MKLILYAGAALMIGASIYGFVDYKKTKHKKEFDRMYTGETNKKSMQATTVVTNVKTTNENKVTAKKEEVKSDKPIVSFNENKVVKKTAKKRKFKFSEFSRAPIKEEVIESPAPAKKET